VAIRDEPSGTVARQPAVAREVLTPALLAWHATAERRLAIREAATPWEVLLAEVMSQQTQIDRVGPGWRRFADTWPTPAALAVAGTRELLAAWAGLGYNRRALALRAAAARIVSEHGGEVPATVEALEALPGIGPYTARAIAATAFGIPVAPLDVNVRRVVGRVTGMGPSDRRLQAVADALVDPADPRRWCNAVMDLAAGTCTRREPRCGSCPIAAWCASRGTNDEPAAAATRRPLPFPATTRWLRGRLVAWLTEAPAGAWQTLPDRLGVHDAPAIHRAASDLERDGFLELDGDRVRLRA
jgi:A/G-specific adenine glycosylase